MQSLIFTVVVLNAFLFLKFLYLCSTNFQWNTLNYVTYESRYTNEHVLPQQMFIYILCCGYVFLRYHTSLLFIACIKHFESDILLFLSDATEVLE